jgi:hypothetical protein
MRLQNARGSFSRVKSASGAFGVDYSSFAKGHKRQRLLDLALAEKLSEVFQTALHVHL